ncbi:MAG: cell surface protein SprA, partial [Flavobacteriales bacterium]|nr:cell surface protein SprA [Flavobacteriales bacterium]
SRKSYENGLPIDGGDDNVDTTAWGRVPSVQALVTAFNSGESARDNQDVGIDGLDDEMERNFIPFNSLESRSYLERIRESFGEQSDAFLKANEDPSGDNFHFFYGSDYDAEKKSILERYKKYNGLDGNAPMNDVSQASYSQLPDVEDINSDYTLSESESYFQYRIRLEPDSLQEVGQNFITSIIENAGPNNDTRWIQFKVPIRDYENKIGSIPDFKSIRFMRMFMKGFTTPTVLRFATLDMVRGEWRKYLNSLASPNVPEGEGTSFDISVVNLEENGRRDPINYVLPPGINRDRVLGSTATQQLNEQSMSFRVCDLQNGDARGAFKNVTMDMRSYNKIKFFVHAEEKNPENTLNDKDLSMFIRVGTDYSYNYYEYEVPLDVTQWGASARDEIWPEANEFEINFNKLKEAKAARNLEIRNGNTDVSFTTPFYYYYGTRRITIIGNPNLGNVRTIMLGVRNPLEDATFNPEDDGQDKCAELWINELRLTDFDERGGWAAKAQMKTRLADVGSFSLGGNISSIGFGGLEQTVNERNKEETRQYNFTSNIELGKFFPERYNVKIPLYVGISETVLRPQFNPLDPDVELQASIDAEQTQGAKDTLRSIVENYTLRRSINLTNVRKERGGGRKQSIQKSRNPKGKKSKGAPKNKLYDIENISLSYSYNEVFNRNINTEFSKLQEHNGGIGYNFNNNPKNYKPFGKIKFLKKSKYLRLIKDFNFYLLPKTISARTDFNKSYSETKMRNLASLNSLSSATIIEPDTMFNKMFNITQNYSLKYDLTRSIKLNFSTNSRSIVDEPEGKIDTQAERDALRDSILSFGRTTSYHHQFDVRYTVPINKFPLTDWVTLSLNYDATYDWNAGSRATVNDSINLGNVIQNTNNIKINTQLNLKSLYNKVPYFKKVNSSRRKKDSKKSRNNKFIGGDEESNKSDKDSDEEEEEEREFKGFEYLT